MEHNEVQAELAAVEMALRAHAAHSVELADRISKLIQPNMESTGLVEVVDAMPLYELFKKTEIAFPHFSSLNITRLKHCLIAEQIFTVGDLRALLKLHGRAARDWDKTAPYAVYCQKIPNVGKKSIAMLAAIIEHFGI